MNDEVSPPTWNRPPDTMQEACGAVFEEVKTMTTVNLSDAAIRLPEIISSLNPGEQLAIVKNGQPLALLTRTEPLSWPCRAGSAKHLLHGSAGFQRPS